MADYTPERGPNPAGIDLTHGIITSSYQGRATTAGAAIARRLAPHGDKGVSAYDHELLLPATAPDLLRKLHVLMELYESQLLPDQHDLLGITTVRFDHDRLCHEQWELARGWAHASLTARGLPVVVVHHLPGLAGRRHKPNCHLIWPVRVLHGSTFSCFSELAGPGAKAVLADEWAAWLKDKG
jgi:hypothetical protein